MFSRFWHVFFMTLCWLINPHLTIAWFCSHVFLMRLKFCAHPSQNIQNWLRCVCRFPQATSTVPDYLPDPTEAAGQTEVTSMQRLTTCSLEWLEPNGGCSLRFDFISKNAAVSQYEVIEYVKACIWKYLVNRCNTSLDIRHRPVIRWVESNPKNGTRDINLSWDVSIKGTAHQKCFKM